MFLQTVPSIRSRQYTTTCSHLHAVLTFPQNVSYYFHITWLWPDLADGCGVNGKNAAPWWLRFMTFLFKDLFTLQNVQTSFYGQLEFVSFHAGRYNQIWVHLICNPLIQLWGRQNFVITLIDYTVCQHYLTFFQSAALLKCTSRKTSSLVLQERLSQMMPWQ